MRRRLLLAASLLTVIAVGAAAVSALAATSVSVTAGKPQELRFTLSKKSVAAGSVTFKVKNSGSVAHDFKINGKRTKLLKRGASTTLTVALKKGSYTYQCTVPGHAAGGMKGKLTVK